MTERSFGEDDGAMMEANREQQRKAAGYVNRLHNIYYVIAPTLTSLLSLPRSGNTPKLTLDGAEYFQRLAS